MFVATKDHVKTVLSCAVFWLWLLFSFRKFEGGIAEKLLCISSPVFFWNPSCDVLLYSSQCLLMHHPSLSYWVWLNRFYYKSSVYEDSTEDPDTYDRYISYRVFLSSLACLGRLLCQWRSPGEIKDIDKVFLSRIPTLTKVQRSSEGIVVHLVFSKKIPTSALFLVRLIP